MHVVPLEDESGMANTVVRPDICRAQREIWCKAPGPDRPLRGRAGQGAGGVRGEPPREFLAVLTSDAGTLRTGAVGRQTRGCLSCNRVNAKQ